MSENTDRTPPSRRAAAPVANETIDILLDDLTAHRDQAVVFPFATEAEIASLAADMHERGQQQPIEVTPDRVIMSGHQRVEAARRLGWATIRAVVRHDLAQRGQAAINQHLVAENLHRRHLSPLAKARAALYLVEQRFVESNPEESRNDVRQAVGRLIGISSREVSRLLAVLDTPPEVQQAYDARRVSLVLAGKVRRLPDPLKDSIVAAIRAGRSPSTVITAAVREARATSASEPQENQEFERDYIESFEGLKIIMDDMSRFIDVPGRPRRGSRGRIRKLHEILAAIGELIQREMEAN